MPVNSFSSERPKSGVLVNNMKKLLFCALLCAPAIISHADDAPMVMAQNQTDTTQATQATQLAWKVALAINDVEAARRLVAAPDFSPTLKIESWKKTLIDGALTYNRGEIAALMIERAPAEFFLTGKGELTNLGKAENVPALRALLKRGGFDPNTRLGERKIPPLLEAAGVANIEGLRLLLADTRTDVNARDSDGDSALHLASSSAVLGSRAYAPVVALLLADRRTDVNAVNRDGDTPLHLAAFDNNSTANLELLLLDRRVKTVVKNKAGQTALLGAIAGENLPAIELMRTLGVRASMSEMTRAAALRRKKNASAPTLAPTPTQAAWLRIVTKGDLSEARKRAQAADFDPLLKLPDPMSNTLLSAALAHDNPELALILIDAAKSDDYLREGSSRLYLAHTANLPVLQRFLSHADFNPNGDKNSDPLLISAIYEGNVEGVRALLKHPDIQPNALDLLGASGPFGALVTPRPNADKIAQLLLANPRIDPNYRFEYDGETDLQSLAWFAQPAVLRVLANNPRVEVNLASKSGETPLFKAASKSLENAKILLDSGRVKIGPKEREAIDKKKAEWGVSASPLFDDAK